MWMEGQDSQARRGLSSGQLLSAGSDSGIKSGCQHQQLTLPQIRAGATHGREKTKKICGLPDTDTGLDKKIA